jgi:hypothetical protein
MNVIEQIVNALDPANLDANNFCNSGLKVHPVADMFPMIEGKEFEDLCRDIQGSGLQNPIVTLNGVLLDGRNRMRACAKVGVEPTYAQYAWLKNREDEWIISQNLHRRSITPDQRVALVAKYYDWRGAEERARIARKANLGTPTQQKAKTVEREKSPGQPQLPKSEHPIRADIAQKAAVGGGKAKQAIAIAKTKPELLDDVVAGKITLREAEKKVKRATPKPKQSEKQKKALRDTVNQLLNRAQEIATFKDDILDPIQKDIARMNGALGMLLQWARAEARS